MITQWLSGKKTILFGLALLLAGQLPNSFLDRVHVGAVLQACGVAVVVLRLATTGPQTVVAGK